MATGRLPGQSPGLQVTRWSKAPAAGTTTLSGLDDYSVGLTYTAGYESVYLNGVLLDRTTDYTATNGTTIILTTATVAGDIVNVFGTQISPVNGAVPNSNYTTKGDILAASAANTPVRLGVGSNNQVLTADSTASTGIKWSTPTANGWTKIASGSFPAASSVTFNSLSGNNIFIYTQNWSSTSTATLQVRMNGNAGANYVPYNGDVTGVANQLTVSSSIGATSAGYNALLFPMIKGTTGHLCMAGSLGGVYNDGSSSELTSITLLLSAGNFDSGIYEVWSN